MNRSTPWGQADGSDTIAPGIVSYSTPSHGGIQLSQDRRAEMIRRRPDLGHLQTFAGGNWYEEDADVALVIVAFPEFFTPAHVEGARGILPVVIAWAQKRTPVAS